MVVEGLLRYYIFVCGFSFLLLSLRFLSVFFLLLFSLYFSLLVRTSEGRNSNDTPSVLEVTTEKLLYVCICLSIIKRDEKKRCFICCSMEELYLSFLRITGGYFTLRPSLFKN